MTLKENRNWTDYASKSSMHSILSRYYRTYFSFSLHLYLPPPLSLSWYDWSGKLLWAKKLVSCLLVSFDISLMFFSLVVISFHLYLRARRTFINNFTRFDRIKTWIFTCLFSWHSSIECRIRYWPNERRLFRTFIETVVHCPKCSGTVTFPFLANVNMDEVSQ